MDWSAWAETALAKMRAPGWEIRPGDADWRGGAAGAEAALEEVAQTGYEPYYTLKAFVCRNGLDGRP
jgi:hypothetical protein